MNLISIQSHVAYGHVGNAAAIFPLQRLGHEAWAIHTVQFSNHTGYGAFRGRVFDADLVRELAKGLAERGVLGRCDGVLSGYIGDADIGEAVLDTVKEVRAANPAACYCCDPVIGDVGRGVFVRPGIPEFMRERALPLADVITPNQFELDYLAGCATPTLDAALAATEALHARGPRAILVTSLMTRETPADAIDMLASGPDGRFRLRTPRLLVSADGAGDLVAALFFVHYLATGSASRALSLAGSAVFGVLARTAEKGAREMLLVEAQDEIVAPRTQFIAERL
jgi:pyridoxine kinase